MLGAYCIPGSLLIGMPLFFGLLRELPGGLWWLCHGAIANPGRERPGATAEGHALRIIGAQSSFLQSVVSGMLRWVCLRAKFGYVVRFSYSIFRRSRRLSG